MFEILLFGLPLIDGEAPVFFFDPFVVFNPGLFLGFQVRKIAINCELAIFPLLAFVVALHGVPKNLPVCVQLVHVKPFLVDALRVDVILGLDDSGIAAVVPLMDGRAGVSANRCNHGVLR